MDKSTHHQMALEMVSEIFTLKSGLCTITLRQQSKRKWIKPALVEALEVLQVVCLSLEFQDRHSRYRVVEG